MEICTELKQRFIDFRLPERLLPVWHAGDDISIFLCGGASKEEMQFRLAIQARIIALKSPYRYSVHLPENMFLELILGHRKYDLLSLENLLAENVNTVVVPLHEVDPIL